MTNPKAPAPAVHAHHWLLVVGTDELGRHGSRGVCRTCGEERFFVAPSAQEQHRTYGHLPRKAKAD